MSPCEIYPTHLVFNRSEPDEDHTRWGGDLDFCKRWREMGGKLYALDEVRLGHVAKVIVYDSLAAHLRRLSETTLTAQKFLRSCGFVPSLSRGRIYTY